MTEESHEAWVDLRPIDRIAPDEVIPACAMPSPGGRMLCELPATEFYHFLGQHLGVDKQGLFRGWRDTRAPSAV